ncbi:hypothetical protein FGB62_64g137 [Gracilaria domingensis]|nr:hypothetical protein FGB62_64g137 [Gracilaria domingensis]
MSGLRDLHWLTALAGARVVVGRVDWEWRGVPVAVFVGGGNGGIDGLMGLKMHLIVKWWLGRLVLGLVRHCGRAVRGVNGDRTGLRMRTRQAVGVYRRIEVVRREVPVGRRVVLLVLAVVNFAVGILFQVCDEILSQRGSIACNFTALDSVPDGNVLVLHGDGLAGDGVNLVGMLLGGVFVLADVFLALGVLAEVAREVAAQRGGVAGYLAALATVPYGDVLGLLLGGERGGHPFGGGRGEVGWEREGAMGRRKGVGVVPGIGMETGGGGGGGWEY